jgi:RimJ/RimL family protein N-acetyltransferase
MVFPPLAVYGSPASFSGALSTCVHCVDRKYSRDVRHVNTSSRAFDDNSSSRVTCAQEICSTVASCNSEEPHSASAGEQKASRTRVGSFGANPLDKGETEVLFALLPDFWRGGMAGDMAQALTSYLFE